MYTLAHIDSETISPTDGARSSRVPIPLSDDPYMAVMQSYLATITDSEFEPFKDSRETKIPLPLPIAPPPVPPSDDPYLIDSDTEGEGSKDEGPGLEEEEDAPEGQQRAVSVVDTTADEPLNLGYRALRRCELALREGSLPSTFEIGQSFRFVSEQQMVEETLAPRPLM
nr:hypothetical protein [Tanacetum cinerariifolium]